AAAFAKFSGKSLPTVAHWNHAATVYNSTWIVPASNYAGHGTVPVGSTRGISAYRTYDMAGNVREWCLNASGNARFILGGGMNAAYAGDSLFVYLYLPKRGVKPYPAVVYFPGSSAIRDAPQNLQVRAIDFIIKSGRAVLYPVYKGTYQRSDSLNTDVQDTSNFYRDH